MFEVKNNLTIVNFTDNNNASRIKYIVIHYTANDGDKALANTNYFKSVYRGASAHYFVDETSIWRSVTDEDIAWHCGTTGKYAHTLCRNANSIGIEMCSRKTASGTYYIKEEVLKETRELVKELMKKYNIPIENILRHYDVTGKICPEPFVREASQWENFKKGLQTSPVVNQYSIAEENLTAMLAVGVINSPEYWRNQNVQYLNELLSNSIKSNKLGKEINNGITDVNIALNTLVNATIIVSPDYWIGLINANKVQYLKELIINIANKCKTTNS